MAAMSGAMAGIAASQAAAASAAAHKAEVARCKLVIENFDNSTANLTEMRDYSSCVSTVYPKPMTSNEETAAKVLFVVAIIGAIYGLYKAHNEQYMNNGFLDYFMYAAFGFVGLPIILGSIGGIVVGVAWLFS